MNSKLYPENITDIAVELCQYVQEEDIREFHKKLFDMFEIVFRQGSLMGYKLSKFELKDLKTIKQMIDKEVEKEKILYDKL